MSFTFGAEFEALAAKVRELLSERVDADSGDGPV